MTHRQKRLGLYELSDEVRYLVNRQFNWQYESKLMVCTFNAWKAGYLKTASGKDRYPKRFESALDLVFHAMCRQLEADKIIFGYWRNGEFFTKNKNTKHKSTNELHSLHMPQSEWDTLTRGLYYKDSLKPYFVE